jgi:hypothetical protein
MKLAPVLLLLAMAAAPAAAQLLAPTPPAKPDVTAPVNEPVPRQGGDTIADAFVIAALPFSTTGTTAGYSNDYDEVCPWGSSSPDVVYRFDATVYNGVKIDLCGSSYDTKVYVYDAALQLVACNDDYYYDEPCGMYVSMIPHVELLAGNTYYIVVDGYGGDYGDYMFYIGSSLECWIECPPYGIAEGEPPQQNDHDDLFNCGCGCVDGDVRIQELAGDGSGEHAACGRAGWYSHQDLAYRDTDWFSVIAGPGGVVTATLDAEWRTHLFHLAPTDCNGVSPVATATSDCAPATLEIAAAPGEVIWLWVGSATFEPPYGPTPSEYDYTLELSGLLIPVPGEQTTWGAVKSSYR